MHIQGGGGAINNAYKYQRTNSKIQQENSLLNFRFFSTGGNCDITHLINSKV